MKAEVVESLGDAVGRRWQTAQSAKISANRRFAVAAPLSSTPLPIFDWVVAHAESFPGWDRTTFVLMDEQLEGAEPPFSYVPIDDPASYEGFARQHLLGPLAARTGVDIAVQKPPANAIDAFKIEIDLLILAIGVSGNFANVMPGTPLATGWHVAHLTPEFRTEHTNSASRSYGGAVFREFGMSLGPRQIFEAEEVIVVASGSRKRNLVQELLFANDFEPNFPLSVVHHLDAAERVTLFVTPDAMP